jgi:DNA-binding transcriptional LysR family regulator
MAGARFLEKAREMQALKRETIEMLGNLSGDISGEIRILASSVPALYILPKILAEFHSLYPDIAFIVNQADTSQVVQGITTHKADIGFTGSVLESKNCEFIELTDEELVFIAQNNGLYRADKKYKLEELLYSSSFISREQGSGTRIQYEKYFAENAVNLEKIKICASMDNTHSIINAVISGLGISIVSRLAAREMLERKMLTQINLETALPVRKLYMALNKNIAHSHLSKLFMEYTADRFNS